jgi:hypothetical protein
MRAIAGFAFRLMPVLQDAAVPTDYCLVYLRNGACSVRALAEAETFHPVIGPAMEAEALYPRQLRLPERVRETSGEFVIWDVGLGAAANALTVIRLVREGLQGKPAQLRLISFDLTTDAAAFALKHGAELGYVAGYESTLAELIKNHSVKFSDDWLQVEWRLVPGDFPAWLATVCWSGFLHGANRFCHANTPCRSALPKSISSRHFVRPVFAEEKSRDVDGAVVRRFVPPA